jgi:hypothetical protein
MDVQQWKNAVEQMEQEQQQAEQDWANKKSEMDKQIEDVKVGAE